MEHRLIMPTATAVWLVDNTSLTFRQIAKFCGLHELEIQGIADDEVAVGTKGINPIDNEQLTKEEIERAQEDPNYELQLSENPVAEGEQRRRGPRYTPLSRRKDRPDAISWLVKNHPELTAAQISRLVGTTKSTIDAIRERSYWNIANLQPTDPVALGLCTQIELDEAVRIAGNRVAKEKEKEAEANEQGKKLLSTEESLKGEEKPINSLYELGEFSLSGSKVEQNPQ